MSAVPSGFIHDLTLALAHRWEPERQFVIFTAYFDESNTHGKSPTIVMAGWLGSARQWELFERRFNGLRRKYGFEVLHAKKLRAGQGEFKDWSISKRRALVDDLTEIMRINLTEGACFALDHAQYTKGYRSTSLPRGMHMDSQYGACFRVCMSRLIDVVDEARTNHKLNVVVELGHRNIGDIGRIFKEMRDDLCDSGKDLLGTISFADKKSASPLMAADFLAHFYYLRTSNKVLGDEPINPNQVARREAHMTYLGLVPEAFERFKQRFADDREERMAAWRAQREKRKATSSIPVALVLPPDRVG
jgi:hypothetical protein